VGGSLISDPAQAIPAFARQTHQKCAACHVTFPELTPFGRQFKLSGYTLGTRQSLPLSAMLQISSTRTKKVSDPADFPKDGDIMLQVASLLYGGKLTDHIGSFVQWTSEYDGVEHHGQIDNIDLRYANRSKANGKDLIYGISVNNNPTVQDVWNSTPGFGFPYASPTIAVESNAATLIDGGLGQQVAGAGMYGLWNNTLYGELSMYGTADGAFSLFRSGVPSEERVALDGLAPYWRIALQHENGPTSMSVGTYGLYAKLYPDAGNTNGPTNRFTDIGLDAQYQYLTDKHRFSAQASWIHEKQDWKAAFASGESANATDTLKTFRIKGLYMYKKKYGATLAYSATTGDADSGLYGPGEIEGNANGRPDTRAWTAQLEYLPVQNIKLALQYTDYLKFNGATSNYDGVGRDASDNNTLYLLGWLMF
jgi:hypothetical protein